MKRSLVNAGLPTGASPSPTSVVPQPAPFGESGNAGRDVAQDVPAGFDDAWVRMARRCGVEALNRLEIRRRRNA